MKQLRIYFGKYRPTIRGTVVMWVRMEVMILCTLMSYSFYHKVYYQMGNKQSKSYKPPSFKRENWHLIPSPRRNHRPEHGLSYLFRNNLTNEEVEQYQIYFHNQAEYQKYLEFFEWREREDTIVNTKFINTEQTKQFCNTNHNARIYIQHVPVRLSDIEDIPYPENLYVLFSCLDGFQKLFHFVGYFHPQEDFICIDRDGRVKVWLNSDLSKCHTVGSYFSDQTSNFHDSHQHQQQMVSQIIELVQKNTAEQIEASMTFTQYLWKNGKQKLTFKQGKQEIINYAKSNQTEIPNYFQSVLNIFNQDKPSELEDASVTRQDLARHEENRIINQNRNSSRTNPQNKVTTKNYVQSSQIHHKPSRQEGLVASSMPSHTIKKTLTFDKPHQDLYFRPNSQTVTSFYRQNSEVRPQSPVYQLTQPAHTVQNGNHPSVKFNYRGSGFGAVPIYNQIRPLNQQTTTAINTNFSTVVHSSVQPQSRIQPKPQATAVPLQPVGSQRLPISSTVQEVKNTNKLLYSDTTQTYELDQQIVKDIIKYFG